MGADNSSTPTATSNTRCVICRQEIISGATKCTHCDSYQNAWRRRFVFISSSLSVVLALASLSAIAFASLQTRYSSFVARVTNTRFGQLEVNKADRRTFQIELFLSNVGRADGAIEVIKIKLPGNPT